MPVKECARFGCAVASCTVEQAGANSAVASLEEPNEEISGLQNTQYAGRRKCHTGA